jgi:predicted secreted protein
MFSSMTKPISKIVSAFLVLAVAFAMSPRPAIAAALTGLSNTMSSQKVSEASNHTIIFTSPSGVGAGETITVTFPAGFTIGSVDHTDIDVEDDGSDVTVGATASGATWGAAFSSQVLTITSGTGVIAAGSEITIEIGTNADSGDQQITNNSTADTYTIAIAGTFGDTGNILIPILDDDEVSITADVGQTLSFSISDNTIGFGTLTSGSARYATGDTAGSGTETSAHNLVIGTNASSGYTVTFTASNTLAFGTDEIDIATITGDSDGTPGTEQFAINFTTDGDATIATAYANASDNWSMATGTATTIASETVPTADETIGAYYLANIASLTPAGSYSTTLVYIATANY